jgi:hypothetical protein
MSTDSDPGDEEVILQLLEEEKVGDMQRAIDEIMSYGMVRFIDSTIAMVEFYWLGFFGERSTIQSDKTIWTARKDKGGDWELDDWDGFNDVVSFDVTTENVPWDQLLKAFHFASPQEMAEELVMHPHFENQVIELMAKLPAETPSSHVVHDPILRKAMAHFDD